MAKIEINTVEVEKVVIQEEKRVWLDLSMEEAFAIKKMIGTTSFNSRIKNNKLTPDESLLASDVYAVLTSVECCF